MTHYKVRVVRAGVEVEVDSSDKEYTNSKLTELLTKFQVVRGTPLIPPIGSRRRPAVFVMEPTDAWDLNRRPRARQLQSPAARARPGPVCARPVVVVDILHQDPLGCRSPITIDMVKACPRGPRVLLGISRHLARRDYALAALPAEATRRRRTTFDVTAAAYGWWRLAERSRLIGTGRY